MASQVGLPAYPSFDCKSDGRAVRWSKWINRLENNVFVAYDIKDDKKKRALLLTYGGEELNDIADTLDVKVPAEGETLFGNLKQALSDYFNPQANIEFQKYVFRNTVQKTDSIDDFYNALKQLAATCG